MAYVAHDPVELLPPISRQYPIMQDQLIRDHPEPTACDLNEAENVRSKPGLTAIFREFPQVLAHDQPILWQFKIIRNFAR